MPVEVARVQVGDVGLVQGGDQRVDGEDRRQTSGRRRRRWQAQPFAERADGMSESGASRRQRLLAVQRPVLAFLLVVTVSVLLVVCGL